MRLVTARVAVGVVLMASNRIVPVHDVNGTVGPDVHVDWTKITVGRAQQGLFPFQLEPGPLVGHGKYLDPVGLEVPGRELALQLFGQMSAIQIAYTAIASRITNPRKLEPVLGGNLSGGQAGYPTRPIDDEHLSPLVKGHAPGIGRTHPVVKERIQTQTPWTQPIDSRLIKIARTQGGFHP